jgi:putative transcriptional regulator
MSELFDNLMQSLREADEIAKGLRPPARVHQVDVPDTDVPAIRARSGLSQAEFARQIGVPKGTLVNWEQGRRRPDGPARVLLALIAKDPEIVARVLG